MPNIGPLVMTRDRALHEACTYQQLRLTPACVLQPLEAILPARRTNQYTLAISEGTQTFDSTEVI